jgi:AcrR family transcriptional regulator
MHGDEIKLASKKTSAEKRPKPAGRKSARPVLGRTEWLAAARILLIADGIDGVKVDRLAKMLKVTRGGFYWRFSDLQDLLGDLIEDWRTTNGPLMVAPLKVPGRPMDQFRALAHLWIEESDYNPGYDMAVRAWARIDKSIAPIVQTIDQYRVDALRDWFLSAGYLPEDALVRAQIVYYHQVGFYALDVKISKAERYRRLEKYVEALTGLANLGAKTARRRLA